MALETLTIEECEKFQYLPTEFFQKFNTIKVLSIENCPKLTTHGISDIQLPSIIDEPIIGSCGDLEVPLLCSANLASLDLSGLHAVKKIDSSFFGSSGGCAFPSLKYLFFEDLPNLEEWIGIDDGCMFPKLHTMEINGCPNLSRLPALPQFLNQLLIFDVGLTALPAVNENWGNNNRQEYFQALENLTIGQCDRLEYIPTEFFQKFNTVKFLIIKKKCLKLTTRGISNIRPPSILNELSTGSCGDLEVSFLWSANLSSVTQLELLDCASITSLPPAQVCAWWTMLSHKCVHCPPSIDCFLKLGELSIDHHVLLLMEPLRSLSISSLTLSDASQLTILHEEWLMQNHAALKLLIIRNAVSLQSLRPSMTKLCFLESLDVDNARLIQSLPDLPTSLCTLHISWRHPVLKERCQENIGLD